MAPPEPPRTTRTSMFVLGAGLLTLGIGIGLITHDLVLHGVVATVPPTAPNTVPPTTVPPTTPNTVPPTAAAPISPDLAALPDLGCSGSPPDADRPVVVPLSRPDAGAASASSTLACAPGMALVPEGTLSASGAAPIAVHGFCMDVTEVTVADYKACVEAGQCKSRPHEGECETTDDCSEMGSAACACNYSHADRAQYPVNCVDWNQAADFCKARNKELPTDAEFEWAARGANPDWRFPWGVRMVSNHACWNARAGTCATQKFPAGQSPQGIHDLAGNVWEWTAGRSVRGGGFGTDASDGVSARSRRRMEASRWCDTVGFRCVTRGPGLNAK